MVSHDLLKRFSAGFQRFQKTWYCPENNIYEDLRVGQHPYALVIACSDSRVDPVLLLERRPAICSSSGTSPTLSLPTNRTPITTASAPRWNTRSATCTSAHHGHGAREMRRLYQPA